MTTNGVIMNIASLFNSLNNMAKIGIESQVKLILRTLINAWINSKIHKEASKKEIGLNMKTRYYITGFQSTVHINGQNAQKTYQVDVESNVEKDGSIFLIQI